MDIFTGYLQHKWQVRAEDHGTGCDNVSGESPSALLLLFTGKNSSFFPPPPPPKNPLLTSFDRCFQASALLLFNASDRLTYSEIMSQLNLTDDDVVRLLHSLSCAKYKILNKEPSSKTISSTDTFEFNSKFTDKMRRIKVPSLLRSLLPLLWRLFIYPLRTKIIKKLKIQTADPAPSR